MCAGLDWTTQAVAQQHTSPLLARGEARRREVVICGCGNGLARDASVASKVDDGLRAGGPQGLQAEPGGVGYRNFTGLNFNVKFRVKFHDTSPEISR